MTNLLYLKIGESGINRDSLPNNELKQEYDDITESEKMIEKLELKYFEMTHPDRQKFSNGEAYTRIGRACWYHKLKHVYGILVGAGK